MTALGRMPALFPFAGICLALLVQQRGVSLIWDSLLAMLGTLALLFLFTDRDAPDYWKAATGLLLIAGIGSMGVCLRVSEPFDHAGERYKGQGVVLYERSWGGRRALLLRTSVGRVMVKVGPQYELLPGDKIKLSGILLELPSDKDNSFREDLYWKARGAVGEIIPEDVSLLGSSRWMSPIGWRNTLVQRILLTLPPRTRGYILACWTGLKSPVLSFKHQQWGTSHLLAVSGFHVALFVSGLWLLIPAGKKRELVVSGALWGYIFLTGAAPSAIRAAIMMQIALLGRLFGRPPSPVNSVSLAGLLLLLWRPFWFWDLGWRLSIIAALIIAAALERRLSPLWWCSVSPAIWVSTLPLVSAVWGSVPLAGVVMNTFAGAVFGVLYPLSSLLVLPSLLAIPGGYWLSRSAEGLFYLWELCADTIVRFVPCHVSWSPFWGAFAAGILPLFLARSIRLSWKRSLSTALLLQCVVILILM